MVVDMFKYRVLYDGVPLLSRKGRDRHTNHKIRTVHASNSIAPELYPTDGAVESYPRQMGSRLTAASRNSFTRSWRRGVQKFGGPCRRLLIYRVRDRCCYICSHGRGCKSSTAPRPFETFLSAARVRCRCCDSTFLYTTLFGRLDHRCVFVELLLVAIVSDCLRTANLSNGLQSYPRDQSSLAQQGRQCVAAYSRVSGRSTEHPRSRCHLFRTCEDKMGHQLCFHVLLRLCNRHGRLGRVVSSNGLVQL
jgi:hypothetical protein